MNAAALVSEPFRFCCISPSYYYLGISTAVLRSPVYGDVDSKCEISFWLHKKGQSALPSTIRLNIYPNTPALPVNEKDKSRLYATTSSYGESWQNVTVGIGERKGGFVLEFESIKLFSGGDIAVDDISFSNCAPGKILYGG